MIKNPKNIDLHLFENHHNYDLQLPKPSFQGYTLINSKKQFVADSSFLEYVKTGMISYIGPYIVKVKQEVIMENKLLVEQPAKVTYGGTVESFVSNGEHKKCPKNVIQESEDDKVDVLLNEGPSDGITIIND